jgi:uncharacterized protein (TIGR02996 family)
MSTESGFLSEIRERPGDDAPRLVFADWLDDQGDADRAEFVRAQVRLAALPEWDAARFDLEERALDLLAEHRERWLAHLPKWARAEELTFRRGLPESASLTPATFVSHGDRLAQLIPLCHVRLDGSDRMLAVAGREATRRLTELEFNYFSGSEAEQRRFFSLLEAPRLRRLGLRRGSRTMNAPEVLADWPGLARLTDLRVSASPSGEAILKSPHLGPLRRLALNDCDLDGHAWATLASCKQLGGLQSLDVSGNAPGLGIAALASAEWPELDAFFFSLPSGSPEGAGPLLGSRWAARLRSFEMSVSGQPTARSLSDYQPQALAHLYLHNTRLGDAGIAELASAECLTNLTSLHLPYNDLGVVGAEALARSTKLTKLVRLDLTRNGTIGAAGVTALVESPNLGALGELRLAYVRAGSDVARLAALPGLSRLRVLDLNNHYVGPQGVAALAKSAHLRRLVRLTLAFNNLGDDGVKALLQAAWLPDLRELDLGANGITDAGVQTLTNCPSLARLRVLRLYGNRQVTAAGTAALAGSPHLSRLLRLELSGRGIDRAGRDRLRERFGPCVSFGY